MRQSVDQLMSPVASAGYGLHCRCLSTPGAARNWSFCMAILELNSWPGMTVLCHAYLEGTWARDRTHHGGEVMRRVAVIGAGVIGLSVAHELARAGHDVTVLADVDTADTVSAVAAALWFPYRSEQSSGVDHLLERSLARFMELAVDGDAGIDLRTGTVVERVEHPDRSWTRFLPDAVDATPEQLPEGAQSGVRARVPLIVIPVYLSWLRAQVTALGVTFERRTITDLSEMSASADAAVVAAGIRGGELLGDDDTVYPVRGQIVRLANPGLTEWITDEDNPDGLTYVFPRREDVIVGGEATVGSWNTSIDPETETAILERACRLQPALRGQAVLGRAAGLRPARKTIRLEHVHGHAMPVIAAYGHGGAGVTLSWGTAERVLGLLQERQFESSEER